MKKKILAVILAATMALSIMACGGSNNQKNEDSKTEETQTLEDDNSSDEISEDSSNESEVPSVEESAAFSPIGDSLAIDFDIYDPTEFPKDTTGRWYKALFAESGIEFQYYALNYYQKYFDSDDEVHVVYNFSTNTVNCITYVAGSLSVRVSDYVKGEEHDASVACGGTQLAEYFVDINSGMIEKI